jgi:predicted DNA binding CopG/RHH family protein
MRRKSTSKVPKFASEADEAAWYATAEGRRHTRREYEKALRKGTLLRSERVDDSILLQLMNQAKERTTRAISIRLPIADIERAQTIAGQKEIGYQTVLKEIIHEGLANRSEDLSHRAGAKRIAGSKVSRSR